MKQGSDTCQVYLFDIDHEQEASRFTGRRFERHVRIVASHEDRARDRLKQMYPHWRVLDLQVQPFSPHLHPAKTNARTQVGLHP